MFDSVDDYLAQLKSELSGADPALVQDALADAEDHLRTGLAQLLNSDAELSHAEALHRVVEEYGSPEEVTAAYRQMEVRVPLPLAPPTAPDTRSAAARFFGVFLDPRAYASLFYMLFAMITGIAYFTWAITGLSLSVGLIVLIIGIPFFALFLLSVQGIALVEGRLVEGLLGVRMPRRPLFSKKHLGLWDRLKALVTDKLSWTTILYMVLQLPLGIIYFTLFVTLFSVGLAGIAEPILQYGFDLPIINIDDYYYYVPVWMVPFMMLAGALTILVAMHLAKLLGRLHANYAKALLVRN